MARGLKLGVRFSAQIWNYFARTFNKNPMKMTKRQALSQLKSKASRSQRLTKLMLTKEGKASKFWRKSTFWSQMKDNMRGVQVRKSRKGNPYLAWKWTKEEVRIVQRSVTRPKTAHEALVSVDSPHTLAAVKSKARRLKKKARK